MKIKFRNTIFPILSFAFFCMSTHTYAGSKDLGKLVYKESKKISSLDLSGKIDWHVCAAKNIIIDCSEKKDDIEEGARLVHNTLAILEDRAMKMEDAQTTKVIRAIRVVIGLWNYWDEMSCVETTGYLNSRSLFDD